jgi:hypothetical protein
MRVDIQRNEAGGAALITIADEAGQVLSMAVRRTTAGTSGDLKSIDGRTWNHNSNAEINLLILHARAFVTVPELLADLGPCDEERIAELKPCRRI